MTKVEHVLTIKENVNLRLPTILVHGHAATLYVLTLGSLSTAHQKKDGHWDGAEERGASEDVLLLIGHEAR